MAFDIYRENRRVGLIHLTNLRTRIQFFFITISHILCCYTLHLSIITCYILLQYVLHGL